MLHVCILVQTNDPSYLYRHNELGILHSLSDSSWQLLLPMHQTCYPQLSYIDIWMFSSPCLLFSSYSHQIVYCTTINNWGYPFMLCTWYYFLIAIPCFTVFKKENPFYTCGVILLKCSHPKLLAGCWPKLLACVFCFDVLLLVWSFFQISTQTFVAFFLICHSLLYVYTFYLLVIKFPINRRASVAHILWNDPNTRLTHTETQHIGFF